MRWFGTHNRNKGLLTDDRDIQQFQLARDEDAKKKGHRIRELELDPNNSYNLVDLWLLCDPDAEQAAVIYERMSEFAEQNAPAVSHDSVISWMATAVRCLPTNLVPRGEGVTIREKFTLPSDPRGCDWNHHTGGTQACLLLQYLSKCSLQQLDVDERANIMFAVVRIFTDSPDVAESPLVEPFVRNLHPAETRVEFIDALAANYFQISDDVATKAEGIRQLYRILDDEPLVLRLTLEILMCLCQRSEVAVTIPDFRMGDQMYCNQVKVIILDLTSDAHDQVPEAYQKDELSTLVNEVFNLKKRQPE